MNIQELAKKAGWPGFLVSMIQGTEDEKRLERFADLVLEEAANGADALAKKWWARHCETNRHMETTREAHEDFCQLGRAIRALKGAKE